MNAAHRHNQIPFQPFGRRKNWSVNTFPVAGDVQSSH
uniref:Uncharacterized protein n=1 Tax=Rhizophora mucronata TaxID=61149 RepID=A0A2P2ILA7_RHIMU